PPWPEGVETRLVARIRWSRCSRAGWCSAIRQTTRGCGARCGRRSPRPRIEALRPTIERVVDELLDGLPEEFDFLTEFAVPLPAIVISELLGIPPEDHERFRAWSQDLATLVFPSRLPDRHRRAREAGTALADS